MLSLRWRSARAVWLAMLALATPAAARPDDPEIATFSAFVDDTWKVHVASGNAPARALLKESRVQEGGAIDRAGKRILVLVDRRVLVVVDARGERLKTIPLGDGTYAHPAWIDEQTVAITSYTATSTGESSHFERIDLRTGSVRPLLSQTGVVDFAAVSPDGRYLAYSLGLTVALHHGAVNIVQQLWVMDLRTGRARQVLMNDARNTHPDWSPDGGSIAISSDVEGQADIFVVEVSSGRARRVSKGPGSKSWPRWSHDGRSLLYTAVLEGRQQLMTIPSSGGDARNFPPSSASSFANVKDGEW